MSEPGPSNGTTQRGPKRRPLQFNIHQKKRLRCGPNSFLVVGNKHDPLNLESYDPEFADDEDGELELNPADPLNLNSPQRNKKKRRRHRRVHDEASDDLCSPVFVSQRRFSMAQACKKQHYQQQHYQQQQQQAAAAAAASSSSYDGVNAEESNPEPSSSVPQGKSEKAIKNAMRYRFGNFNRYYGNKPMCGIVDYRLNYLCKNMFEEKNVLDIGCNSGLLTISIAREFLPTRIVGIDLDPHLIRAARQNVQFFRDRDLKVAHRFPTSFPPCFGPISAPVTGESIEFPQNLEFVNENYVFENDSDLANVQSEYDTILLLGTTKWMHLNTGDDGMKRAFKRIYRQLKYGGQLLVEVLPFDSYRNTAKQCALLQNTYEKIKFRPESFVEYLLSNEVGFRDFADAGIAFAEFSGPLYIFFKEQLVKPRV